LGNTFRVIVYNQYLFYKNNTKGKVFVSGDDVFGWCQKFLNFSCLGKDKDEGKAGLG